MSQADFFVESMQPLLGTWRGKGEGRYPTIATFTYGEELVFARAHPKKAVVSYSHKTWKLEDSMPMHAESGYLRVNSCANVQRDPEEPAILNVEAVIAQATGLAEASVGKWTELYRPFGEHATLELRSDSVAHAAKVQEITRLYRVHKDGNTLDYEVQMRTDTQPLQTHLKATLQRVTV